MICTRLRPGYLSVRVGDISRRSEEIVKKKSRNCASECDNYYTAIDQRVQNSLYYSLDGLVVMGPSRLRKIKNRSPANPADSPQWCKDWYSSGCSARHQGPVSGKPTTVKWRQSSQSNRHSTIGTRQTEDHEALPSSANVQSHLTSSFADDSSASWYWVCRVPMVEWRLDCENCRHLTVVGLHNTGPRRYNIRASTSLTQCVLWMG